MKLEPSLHMGGTSTCLSHYQKWNAKKNTIKLVCKILCQEKKTSSMCHVKQLWLSFSFYRFGWYLPTSFVEGLWNDSRIIADSWRALQLQSVVGQLLQNASLLNSYINISEYKKSCEDIAGCSHGWLHGTKCRDGDNAMHCAVLLADFPGGFVS